MSWILAYLLRPIFMLALFGLVVIPLELLILRFVPQGRARRLLTHRFGSSAATKQERTS